MQHNHAYILLPLLKKTAEVPNGSLKSPTILSEGCCLLACFLAASPKTKLVHTLWWLWQKYLGIFKGNEWLTMVNL